MYLNIACMFFALVLDSFISALHSSSLAIISIWSYLISISTILIASSLLDMASYLGCVQITWMTANTIDPITNVAGMNKSMWYFWIEKEINWYKPSTIDSTWDYKNILVNNNAFQRVETTSPWRKINLQN